LDSPALAVAKGPILKEGELNDLNLDRAEIRGQHFVQVMPSGEEITYTINPDLQQWSKSIMKTYELPYGAIVMYEIATNKVIVMAGYSQRNPTMSDQQLCLTPWAPVASIFKLITASALLDRGVSAQTEVCYHGGLHGLDDENLINNARADTSCNDLSYGVAKSINPIIGKLAKQHLNQDILLQWAGRYGFNVPIPFQLPVQHSEATIPQDKMQMAKIAAGFWHTEASALHGAVIGAVAARGGLLQWPRIIAAIHKPNGKKRIPPVERPKRVLSPQIAERLSEMMVMTTKMGTARTAFFTPGGRPYLAKMDVAGKTGSLTRSNPFLHYNWFVGFAPAPNPRVAFAVLVGNPERWRIKAHTLARLLLSHYFRSRQPASSPKTKRS
jgi:cell division protein FtsI/penicillin-binding protein 2